MTIRTYRGRTEAEQIKANEASALSHLRGPKPKNLEYVEGVPRAEDGSCGRCGGLLKDDVGIGALVCVMCNRKAKLSP